VTDPDLIARAIASGDRDAFGELVRRHQSDVRRYLRHLVAGDHARADDLAQDTFLQAFRGLGRFQGGSTVKTWLMGIAHNLWRNDRRRLRPVPLDEAGPERIDPGPTPAEAGALGHDVAQAIRRLSPDEQQAVHLAYHQGLSHGEIAAVTGWPLGTVKTHLTRAKDQLRTHLSPWQTPR